MTHLTCNGYEFPPSPLSGLKRLGTTNVDHTCPSSAEVKNEWSYTSTPLHALTRGSDEFTLLQVTFPDTAYSNSMCQLRSFVFKAAVRLRHASAERSSAACLYITIRDAYKFPPAVTFLVPSSSRGMPKPSPCARRI